MGTPASMSAAHAAFAAHASIDPSALTTCTTTVTPSLGCIAVSTTCSSVRLSTISASFSAEPAHDARDGGEGKKRRQGPGRGRKERVSACIRLRLAGGCTQTRDDIDRVSTCVCGGGGGHQTRCPLRPGARARGRGDALCTPDAGRTLTSMESISGCSFRAGIVRGPCTAASTTEPSVGCATERCSGQHRSFAVPFDDRKSGGYFIHE